MRLFLYKDLILKILYKVKKYKHSYEEYEGKKLGNIPASTKKSISIELLSGMLEEIADAEKDIKKKKKV